MKKWKAVLAIALIVGLASVITACSSESASSPGGKAPEAGYLQKIKAAGVIQVGSTPTGPPFTFLNPKSNEIEGLMVDVANRIGDELGVKVQINPMTFATLIPSLEADKINMISAGMQKSEERAKVIDFSIPVYSYGETIVVAADNNSIKNLDDLKGKKVGVQEGGLYFQKLKEHPDIVSQGYKSTADMVAELKNGRIDAFLGDYPIIMHMLSENKDLNIKVVSGYQSQWVGDVCIGFPKGSKDFQDAVNAAIEKLQKSGDITIIVSKWGL